MVWFELKSAITLLRIFLIGSDLQESKLVKFCLSIHFPLIQTTFPVETIASKKEEVDPSHQEHDVVDNGKEVNEAEVVRNFLN